jgi:uncharacterized protein (TIGR02172 family)
MVEELGKRIGVGATAEIYEYKDNLVIKLFYENRTEAMVREEYDCLKAVQAIGLKVPYILDMIKVQDRYGYVMEYLKGKNMLDCLVDPEYNAVELIQRFAELQYQIHQIKIDHLRDGKEWLKRRISWTDVLEEEVKQELYRKLNQLPEDNVICHNDFHPGNVITTDEVDYIIDWCDVTYGNALMDVVRTWLVFSVDTLPPDCSEELKAFNAGRKALGELYLSEYMKRSGIRKEQLDTWIPVVAASRLFCEPEEAKQVLLKLIHEGIGF